MPVSLRLYFENPVAQLLEHPQGYAIVAYRPGKRQLADLQALLGHLGRLLKSQGWHRILADQRELSPFTPAESEWIRLNWLTQPGQRSGAVVLANDVFSRLATSQLVHDNKMANLSYRFFESREAAEAWLLTQ